MRQTWYAKQGDAKPSWRVIDAAGVPLGRLAAEVATVLMGKHRPEYTPHIDMGDYVVVVNASQVALTGRKAVHRMAQRFSEYPGGLKEESYGSLRQRRPDALIALAVRRMLPKSRLGRVMIKKLKVYAGAEHPHADKNPTALTV